MKSDKKADSYLRFPLNSILGFKANILVLRTLIEAKTSLSISSIAERTELTIPGVHKVVERLLANGIVYYIGSGKSQSLVIRAEHPMAKIVTRLFEEEKKYFDSLFQELKNVLIDIEIKPDSAWIGGNVANERDEYGDPMQVFLLSSLRNVDKITHQFRHSLKRHNTEEKFDVSVEVKGVTKADVEFDHHLTTKSFIMLWGVDPTKYFIHSANFDNKPFTHYYMDSRSMSEAKIWTKLLKIYPEIIPRTISQLEKSTNDQNIPGHSVLTEWKNILESMPSQRLKKLLESESERSVRLRQSIPFWKVLTDRERNKFREYKIKAEKEI